MIFINGVTMYEFQIGRFIIKFLKPKYINRRNLKIVRLEWDNEN